MQDVRDRLITYIKNNQEKLYRIAFSYAKNEESALDIVQESIMKALKNINKLREEEYVETWFYRILINESLQYVRKNKRLITCDLKDIEDQIEWNDNLDVDGLELFKLVQSLNEKIRTVIILRFFEDMRIDEIAKITNTNVSTVKSRLYKGLKMLKELI